MSAVLNAGFIEGLLKPDGPSLSLQKVDTDLTSPSMPRDFGPESMLAQDAGVVTVEGGTIEAHSRPKPESVADVTTGRASLADGAVTVLGVRSRSGVDIVESQGTTPARAVSTAWSETKGIEIAGVVTISSIRQTATASSTGSAGEAKAEARTEILGLQVAGIPAILDTDGVHAAGQGAQFSLGRSPDQAIDEALAEAGISLRLVRADTEADKDGDRADADAGSLVVDILQTVRAPVDASPQQDAGIEIALGGAHAGVSARHIDPIVADKGTDVVKRRETVITRLPADLPPDIGDGVVDVAPPVVSTGPAFRIVRVMVRHFRPGLTAAFLGVLLAGSLGPLLAFRRNPFAAAILASPRTGHRAFVRYLVRG